MSKDEDYNDDYLFTVSQLEYIRDNIVNILMSLTIPINATLSIFLLRTQIEPLIKIKYMLYIIAIFYFISNMIKIYVINLIEKE